MTETRRALLALACVGVLAGLGISGCKRARTAPGAGTRSSASPGGDAGRALRIALIGKSSTNPVFLSARTGAEMAARDVTAHQGVPVGVMWVTPPRAGGRIQAQRIEQAVSEGAGAILISCSDASKVTAAIDAAVDRGVPVMTFDSDAPDSKRFSFYGPDDRRIGGDVMSELARLLGGRGK